MWTRWNVLRIDFNAFRQAALADPINLDIFEYLTAPALAQVYLNREVFYPNGNLYQYSGYVRDFVMKAIYGGRCMTKQKKRWKITDKLDDFDACNNMKLFISIIEQLNICSVDKQ